MNSILKQRLGSHLIRMDLVTQIHRNLRCNVYEPRERAGKLRLARRALSEAAVITEKIRIHISARPHDYEEAWRLRRLTDAVLSMLNARVIRASRGVRSLP